MADEKGLFCGKVLADLGADVIKVERPGGDPARNVGPFYKDIPHPENSLFWFAFNTSKRGITLNLESRDGQEILKKLVEKVDVVVESFSPGYLDRLGLGYQALAEVNPRVILTSITPFGQEGPYSGFKGSDIVLWAMGGQMYTTGDADRPPVRISIPQAYLHGGIHGAVGSLLALHYRELYGEGQHVDVSIQAAVARVAAMEPIFSKLVKHHPHRTGAGHYVGGGRLHLREIWPCQDGEVAFRIVGGRYGRRLYPLVEWMAREGMAGDLPELNWENPDLYALPDFAHIEATFGKFFLCHTKEELEGEAVERQAMLLRCSTLREILGSPHLSSRDFWVQVGHPELQTAITYPGAPYKLSLTPWRIRRRAPLIGEDNLEIYSELGFSREELVLLKSNNII